VAAEDLQSNQTRMNGSLTKQKRVGFAGAKTEGHKSFVVTPPSAGRAAVLSREHLNRSRR
jgi:hypothetical protein